MTQCPRAFEELPRGRLYDCTGKEGKSSAFLMIVGVGAATLVTRPIDAGTTAALNEGGGL